MPCILAKKGEFTAVKHGFTPKGLASKPCPSFSCAIPRGHPGEWPYHEVRLSLVPWGPFATPLYRIWHWEHDCCVTRILEYSIPCEAEEEGTVGVKEEWYEKTVLLTLDEGDITTTTERALMAQEEDEDVHGKDEMPTQNSTRSRKQVKDNNFIFVYIFMSWSDILKLKYVLGRKSYSQTIINMIWHSRQSTPESLDEKGHESDEQCTM